MSKLNPVLGTLTVFIPCGHIIRIEKKYFPLRGRAIFNKVLLI